MKTASKSFWTFIALILIGTNSSGHAAMPEDITIVRGGFLLRGKFYSAGGEGFLPTAILLHGFPGGDTDVLGLGGKLSESGIHVLFFNYSGVYKSQGEMSMNNALLDIRAAYEFLHQHANIQRHKIDTTRIYLGGWCFGGAMAMTYAAGHPEITSIFTIATNDQGEFFEQYVRNPELKSVIDETFRKTAANTEVVRFEKGAQPFEIAEAGIENLNPNFFLRKSAALLADKDILMIAGWDDEQTTLDHYILPLYRALQRANAPSVRITAFQDDHYFRKTREEVARAVIEWIKTAPERSR